MPNDEQETITPPLDLNQHRPVERLTIAELRVEHARLIALVKSELATGGDISRLGYCRGLLENAKNELEDAALN